MSHVVLAVENPLLRTGIASVVESMEGVRVVAEVDRPEDVREAVARHEPDLLLLETAFRRAEPELLDLLAREFPATSVMVLVDHSFEQCVIRKFVDGTGGVRLADDALERLDDCCLVALRSRARGCVPKTSTPDELRSSLRMVLLGQVSAGPWISALLSRNGVSNGNGAGGDEDQPRISARELEVVELVARGLSNKAIGRTLGIREQTVKNHLAHVMEKLRVGSRLELALFAIRSHLAQADPD